MVVKTVHSMFSDLSTVQHSVCVCVCVCVCWVWIIDRKRACVCMCKRFNVGGFVQTSLHIAAQALNSTCRNYDQAYEYEPTTA